MKWKKPVFWILAVLISLAAMVYQRLTGPTYPMDCTITYSDVEYDFNLPRSHDGDTDCPLELDLPEPIEGKVIWRRFPTEDPWDTIVLVRSEGVLTASLPHQPPAGKVEYLLTLTDNGESINPGDSKSVVVRYKASVPAWALIPHVLLMVLTVIWSTAVIFFALANMPVYKRQVGFTLLFLILGGFILGPVVQKYSFGQFWTGWPLGKDLTDNKVVFALIPFLAAWFLRNKPYGRWLAILAAVVMLVVYLIPHSLNGSELDPETGEVITGSLLLPGILLIPGIRKKFM